MRVHSVSAHDYLANSRMNIVINLKHLQNNIHIADYASANIFMILHWYVYLYIQLDIAMPLFGSNDFLFSFIRFCFMALMLKRLSFGAYFEIIFSRF